MNFPFWELGWPGYHPATRRAQRDAERAEQRTRDLARDVERELAGLEQKCDKALLVAATLWGVLRDRLGVPEEELMARLQELDLEHGSADGGPGPTCPQCARVTSRRHPRCLYCGAELPAPPI